MADLAKDVVAGRTIVITGASRGIGAAAAEAFAEAGASVVLAARSGGALETLAAKIEAAGGRALALEADVADAQAMRALFGAAVEKTGRLDVVINNAGLIDPIARLVDSDPAAWGGVIDVNVKGVYHGLRFAIPEMLSRGGGTVINLSSGAATSALEGWSHYCASKAAALSLTRVADKEHRARGIRVIGLSPGTVATEMQREIKASGLNPVSQLDWSDHIPPEWVARALIWLCGPSGDAYLGQDASLRNPEIRAALGLPSDGARG
ncbi:MAG: SDR family oxidoreductase [Pseudomonadota bacterium]